MKRIFSIIFIAYFLTMSVNAEVISLDNKIYATTDSIRIHLSDGQLKDFDSLSEQEKYYVISKVESNLIILNDKKYIDVNSLSVNMVNDGVGMYAIVKNKEDSVGQKISKEVKKQVIYNGSDIGMQHGYNSYYFKDNVAKALQITKNFWDYNKYPSSYKVFNILQTLGY